MSSPAPPPQTQQQGVRVIFGALILVFLLASLDLVRDWSPEDHAQLEPMLDRLARSLASEMPTPA